MAQKNENAPVITITCPFPDGKCQEWAVDPKAVLFKNQCINRITLGPDFGKCTSQDAAVLAIKEYIRVHKLEETFMKWLVGREGKKGGK